MFSLRQILQKTKFIIISDSVYKFNKIKKEFIETLHVNNIVFEKAFMIKKNPSWGCNISQLNALQRGFESEEAFICIVEDDVTFNDKFEYNILDKELPKEFNLWDSVYLGVSSWGYNNRTELGGTRIELTENKYFVKVLNMFSTHCILYLNKEYLKEIITELTSKTFPIFIEPNDFVNMRSQEYYNCMALNIPVVYQEGKHEYCTKIVLHE